MDEQGIGPKPPAQRPESVVINELKAAYNIPPGSRYDAILTKIAHQEPLDNKEREELESLKKPRKTTKLSAEPLPSPAEPDATRDELLKAIRAHGSVAKDPNIPPPELPSFVNKVTAEPTQKPTHPGVRFFKKFFDKNK